MRAMPRERRRTRRVVYAAAMLVFVTAGPIFLALCCGLRVLLIRPAFSILAERSGISVHWDAAGSPLELHATTAYMDYWRLRSMSGELGPSFYCTWSAPPAERSFNPRIMTAVWLPHRIRSFPGPAVVLPIWLVGAPIPLAGAAVMVARRHRPSASRCRDCGYDVSASPSPCPECGEPTEPTDLPPLASVRVADQLPT
jgi:hypothetical protein